MAKISKKDLIHLTNAEIRGCLETTSIPDVVNEYYMSCERDGGYFFNASTRVSNLLNTIIIERFRNGKIN